MRLVVVVPFLNEEEHLPALLASIEQQTRPPDELNPYPWNNSGAQSYVQKVKDALNDAPWKSPGL